MNCFKNYCSPICVTRLKVAVNMADPISRTVKQFVPVIEDHVPFIM